MISYLTTIESVKYHKVEGNLQNVIKSLSVRTVGTHSDGYVGEFWDKLEFETPHESQFTPFEEITAPMMMSWIESHPSEFYKKGKGYITSYIQQQIDSNEVETTKLPYA
jgi:hypothetical protein